MRGQKQAAAALLAAGASVQARDEHQRSPLHEAVLGSHDDVAAALIAAGAELDAKDAQGHTPLGMSVAKGDAAIVALLLAAGAEAPKGLPALGSETEIQAARERLESAREELKRLRGSKE